MSAGGGLGLSASHVAVGAEVLRNRRDAVMIGRRLGHYRIVSEIGAGGMGIVYRARDEHLERDVAVKVLALF